VVKVLVLAAVPVLLEAQEQVVALEHLEAQEQVELLEAQEQVVALEHLEPLLLMEPQLLQEVMMEIFIYNILLNIYYICIVYK
jgi:hypothetical protein